MKEIIRLNKELPCEKESIDVVISELVDREEFACSGNAGCGVAACAVKDV